MKRILAGLAAAAAALLLGGCAVEPRKFTFWSKRVVWLEQHEEAQVEDVVARARADLQEEALGKFVRKIERAVAGRHDLTVAAADTLMGAKWLPRYDDGLEGWALRGKLTLAIDTTTPGNPNGHLKGEVILAGIHDPTAGDLDGVGIDVAALAAELLGEIVVAAADEAGYEARITERKEQETYPRPE